MKKILWTILMSAAMNLSAFGALYTYNTGFVNGTTIADGSLTGWSDTRTITGGASQITGLTVNLDFSTQNVGDLYVYLSHNGVLVPLLNRVGVDSTHPFGDSNSGSMSITLSDNGANGDIHVNFAGSGAYTPDGRAIDPLGAAATFNNPGTTSFSSIPGGMNGDWTLFFADVVGGGGDSTITSWSLDIITAVPEPINVALGVFGGLFVVGSLCRSERLRKMFVKPEPVNLE